MNPQGPAVVVTGQSILMNESQSQWNSTVNCCAEMAKWVNQRERLRRLCEFLACWTDSEFKNPKQMIVTSRICTLKVTKLFLLFHDSTLFFLCSHQPWHLRGSTTTWSRYLNAPLACQHQMLPDGGPVDDGADIIYLHSDMFIWGSESVSTCILCVSQTKTQEYQSFVTPVSPSVVLRTRIHTIGAYMPQINGWTVMWEPLQVSSMRTWFIVCKKKMLNLYSLKQLVSKFTIHCDCFEKLGCPHMGFGFCIRSTPSDVVLYGLMPVLFRLHFIQRTGKSLLPV